MVYPSKAQTRYIAGLVLVFGLIATTGYVVTQTSTERMKMSGVRTHDIALPAADPSVMDRKWSTTHGIGFIGSASGAPDAVVVEASTDVMSLRPGLSGSLPSFAAAAGGARDFTGGTSIMARTHGAGHTGFSAGGFGMGGVGAWGGVSGHVPSGSGIAAAATAPRLAFRPAASGATGTSSKTSPPRTSSSGLVAGASGVVSPTAAVAPDSVIADAGVGAGGGGLAGGGSFSGGTGSTPGDPGSVPDVDGGGSPGGSPAPNPEPMTLILMGTGLAGLYKARRYLQ